MDFLLVNNLDRLLAVAGQQGTKAPRLENDAQRSPRNPGSSSVISSVGVSSSIKSKSRSRASGVGPVCTTKAVSCCQGPLSSVMG